MLIYILRHGKAGHHAVSDFDRELTKEGMSDSFMIGKFCATTNLLFTHAVTSPLIRARQTADEVLKSTLNVPLSVSDYLTPEADPRKLLKHLHTFSANSRILLVTHEPFAGKCISTLICGNPAAGVRMNTTSLACIETIGLPNEGNGKLLWLVTSDMITSMS